MIVGLVIVLLLLWAALLGWRHGNLAALPVCEHGYANTSRCLDCEKAGND